jgi:hypothetical protein
MGYRKGLLKIWVIGTALIGSISLWLMGMMSGGIGINIASIGGHCALLIGGAIVGAGFGLVFIPILKSFSSALAGDRWELLFLGISAIASIVVARQIWWGSGGKLYITIFGALVGLLLPSVAWNYIRYWLYRFRTSGTKWGEKIRDTFRPKQS